MEGTKEPTVTAYIGRKVSDGNYGTMDAGLWVTVPIGSDRALIEEGITTGNLCFDVMKPAVLDRTRKRAPTDDGTNSY